MVQLTFDDQWRENLIVSFSGGIGSAASALVAHENELEFQCVFADTLIEDEDLHRFMDDVARVIGKECILTAQEPKSSKSTGLNCRDFIPMVFLIITAEDSVFAVDRLSSQRYYSTSLNATSGTSSRKKLPTVKSVKRRDRSSAKTSTVL